MMTSTKTNFFKSSFFVLFFLLLSFCGGGGGGNGGADNSDILNCNGRDCFQANSNFTVNEAPSIDSYTYEVNDRRGDQINHAINLFFGFITSSSFAVFYTNNNDNEYSINETDEKINATYNFNNYEISCTPGRIIKNGSDQQVYSKETENFFGISDLNLNYEYCLVRSFIGEEEISFTMSGTTNIVSQVYVDQFMFNNSSRSSNTEVRFFVKDALVGGNGCIASIQNMFFSEELVLDEEGNESLNSIVDAKVNFKCSDKDIQCDWNLSQTINDSNELDYEEILDLYRPFCEQLN